jgi:hypothetical protein
MISWLSTIDPQTQIIESYSYQGTEPFFDPDGPVIGGSTRIENFYSTSYNEEVEFPAAWTIVFGDDWPPTAQITGLTTRETQQQATSTTTSYSSIEQVTQTTTWQESIYTTVTLASSDSTYKTTQQTTRVGTDIAVDQSTTTKTSYTTIFSGSRYVGDFCATVWMAQDTEVIFVADAAELSAGTVGGAAQQQATTVSATTIYPQDEVTEASVFDISEVNAVSTETTAEITSQLTYETTTLSETTTSVVYAVNSDFAALPLITAASTVNMTSSTTGTISYVEEPSSLINFAYSLPTTITRQIPATARVTKNGFAVDEIFSSSFTTTAKIVDTNWATSETSISQGGNAATYEVTRSRAATVLQYAKPYYTATAIGVEPVRTIAGSTGWKNGNSVKLSIGGAISPVSGQGWFVPVSQGVWSLMPGTFLAYDSNENECTISFSNYSATVSKTNSFGTTTQTAILNAGGDPTTAIVTTDTAVGCFSVNAAQTAFNSFRRGVYRKKGGQTTFQDFAALSLTGGSDVDKYSPVTFFGFNSGYNSKIVWAVPRNSTDLPA